MGICNNLTDFLEFKNLSGFLIVFLHLFQKTMLVSLMINNVNLNNFFLKIIFLQHTKIIENF